MVGKMGQEHGVYIVNRIQNLGRESQVPIVHS